MQRIHEESRRAYGAQRMLRELRAQGISCGLERIKRLRRESGIEASGRWRRNRPKPVPSSPNHLSGLFRVTGPNRVWVGDMTFVRTRAGLLHLSILLDLYSRRIVGWAMGDWQNTELALSALGMALLQRLPKPGLIHHTDRGGAYSSAAFRACLQNNGIISSMSRAYRPNQNAFAERFFNSLKRELVNNTHFPDKETARTAIFEYIEIFYNRQRRHVALGYISPMDFEEQSGEAMVSL